jgi:TP901 family phage tail tape measure protein
MGVTRTISTKLVVEGEAAYSNAISAINREHKNLASAMQLSASEYRNNANSLEALRAKSEGLGNIFALQEKKISTMAEALENCQKAVEKYKARQEELKAALAKNAESMSLLDKSSAGAAEELQKLQEEHKNLTKSLSENEVHLATAEKGVTLWQTKLNSAKIELNQLGDELDKTKGYLAEAETSTDGMATSIDRYGNEVKQAGTATQEFSQVSQQSINALADVLIASGIQQTYRELVNTISACIKASTEFESAITGVYKTVSGTDKQLQNITDGIKKMALELPMTTTELSAIAEAAGQLGIQTDNILAFTKTIANLGNTTNLSAEEAASSLAKFMNITGTAQTEIDRLGSTVVALGNNFATTESAIVNMSMRIASAGTQIGLTEAEILGFSAALSSLGLEAEAGGTAFSTAVKKIQIAVETTSEDLTTFASVAGMSAEAFKNLWNTDASEAVTAFINGLANVEGKSQSTIQMLDEIGFSGIRVSDAWTRLSSNTELVTDALDMANMAWEENTALVNEAAMRYETTESKMQILANACDNLKIAIGDTLKPAIDSMTEGLTDAVTAMTAFVNANEWIGPAIAALTVFVGTITTATVAVKGITIAWGAFQSVLALGGGAVGAVVLALGGLAAAAAAVVTAMANTETAFIDAAEAARKTSEEMRKLEETFREAEQALGINKVAVGNLIEQLTELIKVENKSAAEKMQIESVVERLNEKLPELKLYYDELTDSLNINIESLKSWAEAALLSDKLEAIKQQYKELAEAQEKLMSGFTDENGKFREGIEELESLIIKQQGTVSRAIENWQQAAAAGSYQTQMLESDVVKAQAQLDNYIEALARNKAQYEANEREMNNLTRDFEIFNDKQKEAADAAQELGDAAGEAADGLKDTADAANYTVEQLEALIIETEKAREKYTDLIDSMGEVIVDALKEQAAEELRITRERNAEWLAYEQAAANDRISIYQQEYQEKLKLIDAETAQKLAQRQAEIDAINAQTKREQNERDEASYRKAVEDAKNELNALRSRLYDMRADGSKEYTELVAKIEEKQAALNKLEADYQYKLTLRDREQRIASIRASMDDIKADADAQKDIYKQQFEAQKQSEEERLRSLKNYTAKADEIAQKHYEKTIADENIKNETIRLMTANSQDELIRLLENYAPEWDAAGQKLSDALYNGITSREDAIRAAVERMASYASSLRELDRQISEYRKYQNEKNGTAVDLGGSVADGITEGIYRKGEQLRQAGADAVEEIEEGIKESAGIHSPSRLFMSLGEQMSAGLAQGLLAKADEVEKAVKTIMSEVPGVDGLDISSKISATLPAKIEAALGTISVNAIMRGTEKIQHMQNNPTINIIADISKIKSVEDIIRLAEMAKMSQRMGYVGG